MVNLINTSYDEYIRKYGDRGIVCIGAGFFFRYFLEMHADKIMLLDEIYLILDNNPELSGKKERILYRDIEITGMEQVRSNPDKLRKNSVLMLLTKDEYSLEILGQLDSMPAFDGMDCIYGLGTFTWGYSYYPTPKHPIELSNENDTARIPATIHYCWFGENDIPEDDKHCIESFSRYNPGYEIHMWSEGNYDIAKAPEYVKQAYGKKKYAFVSDYARLDVLYQHGGFYLDTDVELFGSLDFIRKYRMMFAYMEYGEIATGLGMASVPGAEELYEMMAMYEKIPFEYPDGKLNMTPCPRYTNEYFRRKGVVPDNTLEIRDGILFLPSDYLCPLTPVECDDGSYQLAQLCLSERTIGVHWCNNSWKDNEEKKSLLNEKKKRKEINNRLLMDWKRSKGILSDG